MRGLPSPQYLISKTILVAVLERQLSVLQITHHGSSMSLAQLIINCLKLTYIFCQNHYDSINE